MKTSIAVLLTCCGIGITIASCSIIGIKEYNKETKENENYTRVLKVNAEEEITNLAGYSLTFTDTTIDFFYTITTQQPLMLNFYVNNNDTINNYTYLMFRLRNIFYNTTEVFNAGNWISDNYKTIHITEDNLNQNDRQKLIQYQTINQDIVIPTPNVRIQENKLIITIENAENYTFKIFKDNSLYLTTTSTITNLTENGSYSVIAVYENTYQSAMSQAVSFTSTEDYTETIRQLIEENNNLQNQNQNLTNQINNLTNQITNLNTQINYLTESNETLQNQLTTLSNNNTELEQTNNDLQNGYSTLQAIINGKDSQINSLNLQIQEFERTGSAVIDLPGVMLQILAMPWTFITTAFNVTLWEGTNYAINFANVFKGLIAILTLLFIIRLFTNGFNAIGQISNNASQTELNKAKTKESLSKARLNDRTDPNKKD